MKIQIHWEKYKKLKKKAIIPKLTDETKSHEEIVDFLFSIQDLYAYGPQQYAEMVQNINYFYDLYKISFVDNISSYLNYDMMKQFKRNSLNALMSIIFSLPEDKRVRDKINTASAILDQLMTTHLDQISYLIDDCTYKNGYNVDTKIIDYGPKAANEYADMFKIYSYEVY